MTEILLTKNSLRFYQIDSDMDDRSRSEMEAMHHEIEFALWSGYPLARRFAVRAMQTSEMVSVEDAIVVDEELRKLIRFRPHEESLAPPPPRFLVQALLLLSADSWCERTPART